MMVITEDIWERAAILEYDGGMNRKATERQAFFELTGDVMSYPAETVLFCASDTTDESIEAAKAYIRENGLTRDDVRLIKTERTVQVIAKREVY